LVKKQPKGFSFFSNKKILTLNPLRWNGLLKTKNQNHIYHKPRGADKIRFDGRNWFPLWFAEVSPLSECAQGVKESKHKLKCLKSLWQILVAIVLPPYCPTDSIDGGFRAGYNIIISTKFSLSTVFESKVLIHCTPLRHLRTTHPVNIHTPFAITCQPLKLITF